MSTIKAPDNEEEGIKADLSKALKMLETACFSVGDLNVPEADEFIDDMRKKHNIKEE